MLLSATVNHRVAMETVHPNALAAILSNSGVESQINVEFKCYTAKIPTLPSKYMYTPIIQNLALVYGPQLQIMFKYLPVLSHCVLSGGSSYHQSTFAVQSDP